MSENPIIQQEIENAMAALFPHGTGAATHHRIEHFLKKIATIAFHEGRSYALLGLMTAQDVAEHYNISERRARALIANRHKRFGIGMQFGNSWLIHRDELPELEPNDKYRKK